MQADLLAILNTISGWVWGPPTLVLLVAVLIVSIPAIIQRTAGTR